MKTVFAVFGVAAILLVAFLFVGNPQARATAEGWINKNDQAQLQGNQANGGGVIDDSGRPAQPINGVHRAGYGEEFGYGYEGGGYVERPRVEFEIGRGAGCGPRYCAPTEVIRYETYIVVPGHYENRWCASPYGQGCYRPYWVQPVYARRPYRSHGGDFFGKFAFWR